VSEGISLPPTDEPKDYGFTIGQVSESGAVEIGTDGSTPDTWWYRVETKTLQRFLQMASVLSDEVQLNFTDTGIFAKVVDPSHVSMLIVATPGCVPVDESSVMVVTSIELSDLVRCIDKDEDHITLVCGKHQSHLLVQNDNCVTKLRGLNNPLPLPRVPTFDALDANATISCAALTKAVRRMSDITASVLLQSDGDAMGQTKVSLRTPVTGSDCAERIYTLPTESVGGECSTAQTYSLNYLKDFCAALPKAKRDQFDVRMEWSNGHPLFINNNGDDAIDWTWLLAPRLDT